METLIAVELSPEAQWWRKIGLDYLLLGSKLHKKILKKTHKVSSNADI